MRYLGSQAILWVITVVARPFPPSLSGMLLGSTFRSPARVGVARKPVRGTWN